MENWQKNHLTQNIHKLVRTTTCNGTLLARLESLGVLGSADTATITCEKNDLERTRVLYKMIETRVKGFEALALALAEDRQTGSFKIIKEGITKQLLAQFTKTHTENSSLDSVEENIVAEKIQSYITPEDYIKLRDGAFSLENNFQLARTTLPPEIPFYISRTLSKRVIINKAIFNVNCTDIFVFKNIGYYQLDTLVKPQRLAASTSQMEGLTSRFIRLDENVHWEEIRDTADVPVHLVNFEESDKTCVLEESNGVSKILYQYLERSARNLQSWEGAQNEIGIPEDHFVEEIVANIDNNRQPIGYCICDSPGMGKSLLLASIARKIALQFPQRLVTFLKFSHLMKNMQPEDLTGGEKSDLAVKIVLQHLSTSQLAMRILTDIFKANILHLELFLDGLDETDQSKLELAMTFLEMITKAPNTRIFITSRAHLRRQLEASLGIISYDILPFTATNKIDFLVHFWKEQNLSRDYEKLVQFAKFCVQGFESRYSVYERDLTGIPLQCRLLAKVCARKVKIFCQSSGNVPLEKSFKFEDSLPQLYKEYVEMGYEQSESQLASEVNSNDRENRDKGEQRAFSWHGFRKFPSLKLKSSNIGDVKNYHTWVALKVIAPEIAKTFLKQFKVGVPTTVVFSAGLLEQCCTSTDNGDNVEFVHQTFAEFLTAQFFALAFQQQQPHHVWALPFRKKIIEHFWLNILKISQMSIKELETVYGLRCINPKMYFEPVLYFLNFALKDAQLLSTRELLQVLPASLKLTTENQFYGAIWSCIRQNYANIFSIITTVMKGKYFNCMPSSLLPVETYFIQLLNDAAKYSSASLIDNLLNFFRGFCKCDIFAVYSKMKDCMYEETPLTSAVKRGDYEIVAYFASLNSFHRENLIALCVDESNHDSNHVLEKKLDICKLLLSNNKDIIEEVDSCWLYQPHVKLVKWLISQGMNPQVENYKGTTIVHRAVKYMKNTDLHELCRYLLADCQAHDLVNPNLVKYILLKRKDIMVETIQMILEAQLEEQESHLVKKDLLTTIMLTALATNQNKSILEMLITYSEFRDKYTVALNKNTFTFLSLLNVDDDDTPLDNAGNTFLHIAAKNYTAEEYQTLVEYMFSLQKVNTFLVKNESLESPLHTAVGHSEVTRETLAIFKKGGANLNSTDIRGDSILMHAMQRKRSANVLKALLECGVSPSSGRQSTKKSFLHLLPKIYSPKEYHEIVRSIPGDQLAGLFATKCCSGNTPLHNAVLHLEVHTDTIDYLLDRCGNDMDLNAVNSMGESIIYNAVKEERSLPLIKHLVKRGADWSAKDNLNQNLAHVSGWNGLFEHLSYFVELGCDVNEENTSGNNVLMHTLRGAPSDILKLVQYLIRMGANKHHVSKNGETAYTIALNRRITNRRDILDALQ